MARKESLELLLDCKQLELTCCNPDSWMHKEIQKEIEYIKGRLSRQETSNALI